MNSVLEGRPRGTLQFSDFTSGIDGHASQQAAAGGIDYLGRLAKHPRTAIAQPHDEVDAVADGRQLDRPAVRQRWGVDDHQLVMAGQFAEQLAPP